jgi:hypothetical protein
MASRSTRQQQEQTFVDRRQGDTLINAIIGAIVSVVLSFTGVGIILGGVAAGYLQNRGKGAGVKVGGLSGLIAAIPAFLVITLAFGSLSLFSLGAGGSGAFFGFGFLALVVLIFVAIVFVGMGALGGLVGGVLADNQHRNRDQNRSTVQDEDTGGKNERERQY